MGFCVSRFVRHGGDRTPVSLAGRDGARQLQERTRAALHVGQFPHGELLGVVGLAGVARSRADALVAQPAQVGGVQLLVAVVGPQLPADPLVELLRKGLQPGRGVLGQRRGTPTSVPPGAPQAVRGVRGTPPRVPPPAQSRQEQTGWALGSPIVSLAALWPALASAWALTYHIQRSKDSRPLN